MSLADPHLGSGTHREPILTVEGVSKSYGPVRALHQVSTAFRAGEIHAVLGENGAGKSTLMGVIAGFVVPDFGEVALRGSPMPFGRAFAARDLGIQMVHQHFQLVPTLTVAENLALANLGSLVGGLNVREAATPALAVAERLGWPIDPARLTGDLPVGAQQRVEILKALAQSSDVLILDEPTGVLTPGEAEDLFAVLRRLKSEGKAIILIAHKLSEVMAVADTATVLRRGQMVARADLATTSVDQLAEWMVGEPPVTRQKSTPAKGEVRLAARDLRVKGDRGEEAVRGISFEVRAGEVLGIGGVDGNGQVELAEALAGIRPVASGERRVSGAPGYIPQDRQHDGLALGLSITENLLLSGLPPLVRRGPFWSPRAAAAWGAGLVRDYDVKIGRQEDAARSLSGGNQQKLVVARVLDPQPQAVIAVNPTRGLDLKAADAVRQRLRTAAANGAGVVLISTDTDELEATADRIIYLSRGQLSEQLVGGLV